jgi:hypothetical protein
MTCPIHLDGLLHFKKLPKHKHTKTVKLIQDWISKLGFSYSQGCEPSPTSKWCNGTDVTALHIYTCHPDDKAAKISTLVWIPQVAHQTQHPKHPHMYNHIFCGEMMQTPSCHLHPTTSRSAEVSPGGHQNLIRWDLFVNRFISRHWVTVVNLINIASSNKLDVMASKIYTHENFPSLKYMRQQK